MASWQHVALGAVATAGVGLAIYHAKNHKTEEVREKERSRLFQEARTGDSRFVPRMTDPLKAREKWKNMGIHERKAAFHIDRVQLAHKFTRTLRDFTGNSIPDEVLVDENVVNYATLAFKFSLEEGVPVVIIPPTTIPSEILKYRTVIEMLESQFDDGLTVPMVQFRKAVENWQVQKAVEVVWSSLTFFRVLYIYFHLIILWFGLGILDYVTGSWLGILSLPSQLWSASGGSFVMSTLSYLGITSPFTYLYSWTVQPVINLSISKLISDTIGSYLLEFFVVFLIQYMYCVRIGIFTGLLCSLCEFLVAQMLGVFQFLLYAVWFAMLVLGLKYTLVIILPFLLSVIISWKRAGKFISSQYQPEGRLLVLDKKEMESTENAVSLLDDHECYHNIDDGHDSDDFDDDADSTIEEFILDYAQHVAKQTSRSSNSASACSYCHREPKRGQKLKVCSGCKKKRYCNQKCQEYHWITHRASCVKKKKRNRRR